MVKNRSSAKKKYSIFKALRDVKKFKQQNLFFTDEFGNVVSAKKFKNFFIVTSFSLLIALILIIIFVFFLYFTTSKSIDLKQRLTKAEKKVDELKHQISLYKVHTFLSDDNEKDIKRVFKEIGFSHFKIDEEDTFFKVNFLINYKDSKEPLMGKVTIVLEDKNKKTIVFPNYEDDKEIDFSKGQYFSTEMKGGSFQFNMLKNDIRLKDLKKATVYIYSMDDVFLKEQTFNL